MLLCRVDQFGGLGSPQSYARGSASTHAADVLFDNSNLDKPSVV